MRPKEQIVCSTGEVVDTYSEYMRTRHWKHVKELAYEYWGHMCAKCNASGVSLNMHHLTYIRIGRENIYMDVCPLCRSCHIAEHEAHPSSRKLLKHAGECGDLGDVVRIKALARLNDKWMTEEAQTGNALREWLDCERNAVLDIIKDNHVNAINHQLRRKYSEKQYSYICKDKWFLEMMIRKQASAGLLSQGDKNAAILRLYRKHDALKALQVP